MTPPLKSQFGDPAFRKAHGKAAIELSSWFLLLSGRNYGASIENNCRRTIALPHVCYA
jgi:hypothetical protein